MHIPDPTRDIEAIQKYEQECLRITGICQTLVKHITNKDAEALAAFLGLTRAGGSHSPETVIKQGEDMLELDYPGQYLNYAWLKEYIETVYCLRNNCKPEQVSFNYDSENRQWDSCGDSSCGPPVLYIRHTADMTDEDIVKRAAHALRGHTNELKETERLLRERRANLARTKENYLELKAIFETGGEQKK